MIKQGTKAKLRRKELDRFFSSLKSISLTPPRKGWIADIRDSIGMSRSELARRLKIDPSSAKKLEESEARRTITISSLDKAAQAIGCRVEYVLVPDTSLDQIIRTQTEKYVRSLRESVSHTMALEDQASDDQSAIDREEILIDELISKLDREIWKAKR